MTPHSVAPDSVTATAPIHITVYRGARDNRGEALALESWPAFVAALRSELATAAPTKEALPAVGPYLLKPGATRSTEGVVAVTLAALDVDAGLPDVASLLAAIAHYELAAVVHTSPTDPGPGAASRKIRVYLPLSRPLEARECKLLRRALGEALGVQVDPKALDAARIFFVGTLEGASPREVWELQGSPVPVDEVLAIAPAPEPKAARAATHEPAPADPAVMATLIDQLAQALLPVWEAGNRQAWLLECLGWLAGKCWAREERAALVEALIELDPPEPEKAAKYLGMAARAKPLDGPSAAVKEALGEDFDSVDTVVSKHPNIAHNRVAARRKEREAKAPAAAASDDAEAPLIITRNGQCWIRRGTANNYDPALPSRDVGTRLVNLKIDQTHRLPRSNGKIDVGATLEEYGRVAMRLERDFTLIGVSWDAEKETLVEGYRLVPIDAIHDSDVEAWLTALAGGARDELYDWIAGCRQDRLSNPGAALGFIGDADLGKSLFAGALSRAWGYSEPVALRATVAQFDGSKTDAPIWFDDECEAIKAGLISSENFRKLVQLREHFYERKGQEKRRLRGCARIILACNDPSDIRFADVAGPGAVGAIVDRLALFTVASEDSAACRRALDKLRLPGRQDVDVDRVAEHMAWIQENVQPRVQRFLGARVDRTVAQRAAYSGVLASSPALFEVVRDYLLSSGEPDRSYHPDGPSLGDFRLASRGDASGSLLALPGALVDYLTSKGARTDLGAVQRALAPFRRGDRKQHRFGTFNARFWELDVEALCTALGFDEGERAQAAEALGGSTAERMAPSQEKGGRLPKAHRL